MSDSPYLYVLDGLNPDEVDKLLDDLAPEARKVRLDLSGTDFRRLRAALTASRPGEIVEPPEAVRSLVPQAGSVALVPYRDVNWSAFQEGATRVVKERDDKDLSEAWTKIEGVAASGDDKAAAAEYLCCFMPSPEELDKAEIGLLRRLLNGFLEALKRLFKAAKAVGRAIMEVLRDPDAFYLRLRGEVTDFLGRHEAGGLAQILLFLPDLFRLYVRVLVDKRVSLDVKRDLLLALGYLIVPLDLIPEALLGPIGYTEDTFFLAGTVLQLTDRNAVSERLLQEHWAGEPSALAKLMAASEWAAANLQFIHQLWRDYRTAGGRPVEASV